MKILSRLLIVFIFIISLLVAQCGEVRHSKQKKKILIIKRGNLPSRSIAYDRSLYVTATAYCPCKKCCGRGSSGITASGLPARRGIIAVDKRVIKLGSKVYVEGYGFATAADTGSAIRKNKIDVCFPSHKEAVLWGKKKKKIYILPKK